MTSWTTLWTIKSNKKLTADAWKRFAAATRAAGSTPAQVLEQFIFEYTERSSHAAPSTDDRTE